MKHALITLTIFFAAQNIFAYVASSTNYYLERDSLNNFGELSTSSSYSLEDTGGEIGTGYSSSTNFMIHAGYQQNDATSTYITISTPSDITLAPSISKESGGQAAGSATWTVTTNNPAGYTLAIKASASPAMSGSAGSFANYTPAAVVPDFTWSVAGTASEFGFTPEGNDITNTYRDNGVAPCAIGLIDTTAACWDIIATTDKTIASRASANNPSGTGTIVRFQAEAGASANQPAGSYVAVITLTATAL